MASHDDAAVVALSDRQTFPAINIGHYSLASNVIDSPLLLSLSGMSTGIKSAGVNVSEYQSRNTYLPRSVGPNLNFPARLARTRIRI